MHHGIDRRVLCGEIGGEELLSAICDAIEAVARAERFETGVLADKILHAGDGVSGRDVICAVFDVAGPVGEFFGCGER